MTSCYISLNPNKGPVNAHTKIIATATTKVAGPFGVLSTSRSG